MLNSAYHHHNWLSSSILPFPFDVLHLWLTSYVKKFFKENDAFPKKYFLPQYKPYHLRYLSAFWRLYKPYYIYWEKYLYFYKYWENELYFSQYSIWDGHSCTLVYSSRQSVWSDMKFVQNFTLPDFQAKKFYTVNVRNLQHCSLMTYQRECTKYQ